MNFSCALFHNFFFFPLPSFSVSFFFFSWITFFFKSCLYRMHSLKSRCFAIKTFFSRTFNRISTFVGPEKSCFLFPSAQEKKIFYDWKSQIIQPRRFAFGYCLLCSHRRRRNISLSYVLSIFLSQLMFWLSFMLRDDFFFREIFMDHKVLIENLFLVSFERLRENLWSLTNLQNAL